MPKEISLIIVPHDNRTTWNIRVSYRWLYALAVFAVVGLLVGIVVVFTYGRVAGVARMAANVSRENAKLRGQLAEVDSLREADARRPALAGRQRAGG